MLSCACWNTRGTVSTRQLRFYSWHACWFFSSQLHVIASNFRQNDSPLLCQSACSLHVLFLTCWTRSVRHSLTMSPKHVSLKYVSAPHADRWYQLILRLTTLDQGGMLFFCWLVFANVEMVLKDFRLTLFTHHRGKCDSERSDHLLHWWVSDTTGHDRQHSVLTAKIKTDRWTEICWTAHCPISTQARS